MAAHLINLNAQPPNFKLSPLSLFFARSLSLFRSPLPVLRLIVEEGPFYFGLVSFGPVPKIDPLASFGKKRDGQKRERESAYFSSLFAAGQKRERSRTNLRANFKFPRSSSAISVPLFALLSSIGQI